MADVTDIAYLTRFFPELEPEYLRFCAAVAGQRAPDPAQPFTYCELGCGQGLTPAVLAALNPHARFFGLDLHPGQIANARELAAAAGLDNVSFLQESFESVLDRPADALPDFDYVVLHGVLSWVSAADREAIVRFLDRKLKPGGLVYASYDCLPGWAARRPVSRLMQEHAERNPRCSDRQSADAMRFIDGLRQAEFAYFGRNPAVRQWLDKERERDPVFLAHEHLTPDATPFYVTDVTQTLRPAQLDYVASASLLENFDGLTLPDGARQRVHEAEDPEFRELLKSYAINQSFRRDIFIKGAKGAREMTGPERARALRRTGFAPLVRRHAMSTKLQTPLGEATGHKALYEPVLDQLAQGRITVGELVDATGRGLDEVVQACSALLASGQVYTAPGRREGTCARDLNAALTERAVLGGPYRDLAAPDLGVSIPATDIEMVALDELARRRIDGARQLAEALWARFKPAGRFLVRDGETLTTDRANLDELQTRAEALLSEREPVWRALGLL